MDVLVWLLPAVLGSNLLTAVIQRQWARKDKQNDGQAAIVAGLKVMMIDRVRHLGKCYIAKNGITLEDKETVQEMYKAYKALGGNGQLETVMAEINRLPVVKNELR